MSDVLPLNTYTTDQVIELAFAAYRVNNGYEKHTQRYSEGQSTRYSNKELVTYSAYHYKKCDSEFKPWIPADFIPLKVTDEDRAAKAAAEKHMRRYTMLALGDLSEFENDIFTVFSSEAVTLNRIGLVAYLPAFVERELKEKEYKGRLKKEFLESAVINLHKIENTTVEILKVIPLHEYDSYLYFGAIEKDLVCFSKKDILEIGDHYEIRARVKGHDRERETNLPMTRLNYVKLKKVNQ